MSSSSGSEEAGGGILSLLFFGFVIYKFFIEPNGDALVRLALQCLVLVGGIFILVLAGYLLYLLAEIAAQDPQTSVRVVTAPIWLPPYVVAWVALKIARGEVMRAWFIQTGRVYEALTLWEKKLPTALGGVWYVLTWSWLTLSLGLPWYVGLVLAAAWTALFVHIYRVVYHTHLPRSADWAYFIGAGKYRDFRHELDDINRDIDKFIGRR